MRHPTLVVFLFLLLLITSPTALAWNKPGHMANAAITYRDLRDDNNPVLDRPNMTTQPLTTASLSEHTFLSQPQSLTMDDLFSDVAKLVPDFGGMFLSDSEQVLQVYLLNPSPRKLRAAERAIARVFGRQTIPRGGLKALRGRYSFSQLRRWYVRMLSPIFSIRGVTETDIDEASNRLLVGVEKRETEALVIDQIAKLNIPLEAVSVVVTGPIEPLSQPAPPPPTLQSAVSPRQGGYVLSRYMCNHWGNGGPTSATLGFNAIKVQGNISGFVTNSHLTQVTFMLDALANPCPQTYPVGVTCTTSPCPACNFYQDPGPFALAQLVGQENIDPPVFTGGACPPGQTCRWSDSVFGKYNTGIAWAKGIIARTTGISIITSSTPCPGGQLPTTSPVILTIDQSAGLNDVGPGRFGISSYASQPYLTGLKLNKVGRTTGWTTGSIEQTCVNAVNNASVGNSILLCQYVVGNQFDNDSTNDDWRIVYRGDSGSPVFRITNPQWKHIQLYGILWAGSDNAGHCAFRKFFFSPIGGLSFQRTGIQRDLGKLDYVEPCLGPIPAC